MEKLVKVGASLEQAVIDLESGKLEGSEAKSLRDIVCFALPIYNMIAPMFGLPVLPVPAFCNS